MANSPSSYIAIDDFCSHWGDEQVPGPAALQKHLWVELWTLVCFGKVYMLYMVYFLCCKDAVSSSVDPECTKCTYTLVHSSKNAPHHAVTWRLWFSCTMISDLRVVFWKQMTSYLMKLRCKSTCTFLVYMNYLKVFVLAMEKCWNSDALNVCFLNVCHLWFTF